MRMQVKTQLRMLLWHHTRGSTRCNSFECARNEWLVIRGWPFPILQWSFIIRKYIVICNKFLSGRRSRQALIDINVSKRYIIEIYMNASYRHNAETYCFWVRWRKFAVPRLPCLSSHIARPFTWSDTFVWRIAWFSWSSRAINASTFRPIFFFLNGSASLLFMESPAACRIAIVRGRSHEMKRPVGLFILFLTLIEIIILDGECSTSKYRIVFTLTLLCAAGHRPSNCSCTPCNRWNGGIRNELIRDGSIYME